MMEFIKRHPALISFILATIVFSNMVAFFPAAKAAGERPLYWFMLVFIEIISIILVIGQFKSFKLHRRKGSKFLTVLNAILGVALIVFMVLMCLAFMDGLYGWFS